VIRVFIVAAPPLARAGLENVLASRGVEVAGSAATVDAMMDFVSDKSLDLVLVDASGGGFEPALESILDSGLLSDVGFVVLGDGISSGASAEAMRAGIRATLPADISPEQLVAGLEAAASGLLVVHPSQVNDVLPAGAASPRPVDELAEPLTPREVEVLQMLSAGLSNKEIAARLNISDHTVKFHVAAILGKLGAGSRTEAVSIGIRRGLVLL
jgi:two-component system, NarL family, response regulator YdfI